MQNLGTFNSSHLIQINREELANQNFIHEHRKELKSYIRAWDGEEDCLNAIRLLRNLCANPVNQNIFRFRRKLHFCNTIVGQVVVWIFV